MNSRVEPPRPGHDQIGHLPTIQGLWSALFAADRIDEGAEPASEIHRCVKEMVAAHRRWATIGSPAPGDWVGAEAEISRLKESLDSTITTMLGPPTAGAHEHHESYASMMDRIAALYASAWPASGQWGPAQSRTLLGHEFTNYDKVIRRLAAGTLRLPVTATT